MSMLILTFILIYFWFTHVRHNFGGVAWSQTKRCISITKCAISLKLERGLPYSLSQTPWLLFILSPLFVRHLLIPVAAKEAILRETVDWHHWTRRFWPLCWCRRLELVLSIFRYFSCTCHQERVARHVHMLRASQIVGMVRLLFESRDYFIQHFRRCGESGVWSSNTVVLS